MIPKRIHYCWFGRGEMPKLVKWCVKSWKKFCPGWEIVLWNEDSFDVNSTLWTKQAYEAKKYAFVADYVRLKAMYEMGGVYLDSDVELVKPIDEFLKHEAFSGFENPRSVPTGIMASEAGQQVIGRWLDWYTDRPYLIDGKPNMDPNVSFMTEDLVSRGLVLDNTFQIVDGFAMYPQTYFCPLHTDTVEHCRSDKTAAIHYFTSSWRSEKARQGMKLAKRHSTKWYKALVWLRCLPGRTARKLLGEDRVDRIRERLGK